MFKLIKLFAQGVFCCLMLVVGSAKSDQSDESLSLHQTSEQGIFEVSLESQVKGGVEINQFLEWILTVKTTDGAAVTPARILVAGGMPMHGHGLPTQPQVSEDLGDGQYLVEGLKFSMNGRWELSFDIQSKNYRDKVVFDFKIDY